MSGSGLVEKVTSLYQAFGRGDLLSILALVADDVSWGYAIDYAQPGVPPAFGPYLGRDGVVAYFKAVAENLEVKKLQPLSFLSSDTAVAVLIDKDIEVKRTHKSYRGLLVHLFEFDAVGKISRHVHFDDTAAVIEAYR
jgi:ketosteroid isomerase-like protein